MKRIFLFLLLTLSLTATARPRHRATPLRVACIGNSVTYGTGLADPEQDSYPSELQRLLGPAYTVGRFGKPGATLLNKGFRPYMQQDEFHQALAFKPDIAVIHLGLNDTDPRAFPAYRDDFVSDYLALIDSVRAVSPHVRLILARMTPLSHRHRRFESGTRDWHREIQRLIETVAEVSGAELIDFYEPLHQHPDWFPDAIHPTREGYALLAQIVEHAITGRYGGLQLPAAYTSHMVLPRDRPLTLTGTANAADSVLLTIYNKEYRTTTSKTGRWAITIDPLPTGGPYTLSVETRDRRISLTDILAGEVWLATGQSNMALTLQQCGVPRDVAQPQVRLLHYGARWATNDVVFSPSALDSINHLQYFTEAQWTACDEATAPTFSAVGYYFARALADSLHCPVGVITNAVGGSGTEAWVSRTLLEDEMPAVLRDWTHNDFLQEWVRTRALKNIGPDAGPYQRHPYEPCYLYEAAIAPLAALPLSGVIWYQGESNAHNTDAHAKLFSMVVRSFREAWHCPQLPFYYAQLSSLSRPEWPWFRDSQRRLLTLEPHLGMAVTSDLGDSLDVHPRRKAPVGERLARWALHCDYGRTALTPSGPLIKDVTFGPHDAVLHFSYADGLHTSDGRAPRTFELAHTDGLFYPAEARIEGNTIRLTCPALTKAPRYVRYAWQPYTRANLVNGSNLPASTFRW